MTKQQRIRGQVMEAIASALRAAYKPEEIVALGVNIIDQAIRYRCLECCQAKFRCGCAR